jgi:hypothetical protein
VVKLYASISRGSVEGAERGGKTGTVDSPLVATDGGVNGEVTQQHTTATQQHTDAPIYAQLVKERGDVLEDTRQVAAKVLRQAEQAVRLSSLRSGPA